MYRAVISERKVTVRHLIGCAFPRRLNHHANVSELQCPFMKNEQVTGKVCHRMISLLCDARYSEQGG